LLGLEPTGKLEHYLTMRYLLILALLLSVELAQADSNPPSPTPAKSATKPKADTAQHENNAEPNKRGTKKFPASIEISKSPVIQTEATDKTEKRRDYSSSEWWLVYITGTIAFFTLGLMIYTGKLWGATKTLMERAEQTTKTIERAYITMSHLPPGLFLKYQLRPFEIQLKIENYGNTPATVTDIVLGHIVLVEKTLPIDPPYPSASDISFRAFLVKGANFIHNYEVRVSDADFPHVIDDNKTLYIFGYVDYIDKFEKRHRSGYARAYMRSIDTTIYWAEDAINSRNNLVFVTQDGYNYDRPRKKGEGNDWD